MIRKTCSKCKVEKPRSYFGKDKTKKDGLNSQCSDCKSKIYHAWNKRNPTKAREAGWRQQGIDVDQAYKLLANTKECEICGTDKYLVIDHDHDTGCLRGVLCNPCNRAIGKLGDNLESIKKVMEYLRKQEVAING